jgi:hypothetical protein
MISAQMEIKSRMFVKHQQVHQFEVLNSICLLADVLQILQTVQEDGVKGNERKS